MRPVQLAHAGDAPPPAVQAEAAPSVRAGAAPAAQPESAPRCEAWEIEYALAAQVRLSDTMMGAGDGEHAIGPGRLVLRFEDLGGKPGGAVRLTGYEMRDEFAVDSGAVFFRTQVLNQTRTTVDLGGCGAGAAGVLETRGGGESGGGAELRWTEPVRTMHTDGRVHCEGLFCGKLGAPPQGWSPVHTPPHDAELLPLRFSESLSYFSMDYSVVSRMTSPRQTSRIALQGTEVRRACAPALRCP